MSDYNIIRPKIDDNIIEAQTCFFVASLTCYSTGYSLNLKVDEENSSQSDMCSDLANSK